MFQKSILATLGFSLAFVAVANAEPPSQQPYKDAVMRLNADEKNLAIQLENLFRVDAGKYRPKVHQLIQAKRDLSERVRDYDALVAHFTPNVKQLGKACNLISAKLDEVTILDRAITEDANDFGQFMKDTAGDRAAFDSTLAKLGPNTVELCRNSDLAGEAPQPSASAQPAVSSGGSSKDSDHLHADVTVEHEDGANITFNVRGEVKGDWREANSTKLIVTHKDGTTREVPFSSPGGVRNLKEFSGNVTVSRSTDRELSLKTKKLHDDDKDDRDEGFPKEVLPLWTNGG